MESTTLGLTFSETMEGPFALGETDPKAGKKKGKDDDSNLAMHVTINIDDIDRFVEEAEHVGSISGTVDFTPFGENLPVKQGVFNLFFPNDQPDTKLMIYDLNFEHAGKDYFLAGKKVVHDDPGFDLWEDTTTLFTHLHEGTDASGPAVGAGVLKLHLKAIPKVVKSMRGTNANSPVESAKAVLKYGRLFLGELWDSYAKFVDRED